MRPFSMLTAGLLALATLGPATPAFADPIPVWSAETITWMIDRPAGTKLTYLEGDAQTPDKVLTYAFKMPDGAWFPAHTHPSAARVFVMKGVLLLGEGASADRARARRISAGQVALVPAGVAHYEGAEGETVIIGVATGPWRTDFIKP